MARTKTNTQNNTKTRRTPWRNIHLEKNYFLCFSDFSFFFFFFFIYNFLNDFSKKCWVTALERSMTFIGDLLSPTRPLRRRTFIKSTKNDPLLSLILYVSERQNYFYRTRKHSKKWNTQQKVNLIVEYTTNYVNAATVYQNLFDLTFLYLIKTWMCPQKELHR